MAVFVIQMRVINCENCEGDKVRIELKDEGVFVSFKNDGEFACAGATIIPIKEFMDVAQEIAFQRERKMQDEMFRQFVNSN